MRAVIVEEPGDVEALTIKETPTPTPPPGEVLVRTVAPPDQGRILDLGCGSSTWDADSGL